MPKTLRHAVLTIIVLILPVVVVSIILAVRLDATLFDHAPYWSDELYHWHQSATMAEAGLNGGYYTLDENIPTAGWSHYYSWGAYTYLPYAIVMKLFGAALTTIQFTNLVIFVAAAAGFALLTRLDEAQLIWLGLMMATFIPLITYLPSSMLQLLHLAIALLIAAGFYRLLAGDVSTRFLIIFGAFLLAAGLLRPTWSIYLLPMLILAQKNFKPRTLFTAFAISVPLVLVAAFLFYTSTSPFPHFRTRLFLGDATPFDKLISFGEYIWISLGMMREGDPIVMAQRYQIAALIIALIAWGGWQWQRSEKLESWVWEWLLHSFNLFGFYVLTIMFHETLGGHDYRVMSPHLFLSLMLFVAFRRRALLILSFVLGLIFFPAMLDNYKWKDPNFNGMVNEQYAHWQAELAPYLRYDPDAPSPWCNTLTSSSYYVFPGQGDAGLILSVDPGIGLSWAYDWDESGRFSMPERYESHYLMLTHQDTERLQANLNVDALTPVQNGTLYRNLDAPCPEQ